MRVDLHLHTWVSDGDVSPTRVVELALTAGLDVIAITDHDTAAGVAEASEAAASTSLTVVPGIEISSRLGENELHILGYWIDPLSAPILEHQRRAANRRSTRMAAMVERLQEMGVQITFEDVEAAAGPSARSLGRPHLARALHTRRQTRFYGEAFLRFIGDSGPAFVAEGFPTPEHAIEVIHAAGGAAVWAHPNLSLVGELIPALAGMGLDGVECFRPGLDPYDVGHVESLVRHAGLFPTGGSDWHGPNRSTLGSFHLDAVRVADLLALGGVQVV